uniref:Uncharacterized protein n=1 Tax=Anguilla anguilla TaxID=7936 RepID=A0A0E9PLI7_ANGAN
MKQNKMCRCLGLTVSTHDKLSSVDLHESQWGLILRGKAKGNKGQPNYYGCSLHL